MNVETHTDDGHVGELRLRRFRAGEISGPEHEQIARHTSECAPCRSKLRSLQEEQRQFEHDIPFERFAGGVERAARVPRVRPPRVWALGSTFALAAAAAVVVMVWPFGKPAEIMHGRNQIKGGDSALMRIASATGDEQRALQPAEFTALRPGERLRLGYTTTTPGYLSAVSLDDRGEVSALYPEAGGSLAVAATHGTTYLPDSLELTGAGRERIFLFLADRPLDAQTVAQSVRQAHALAKGDLAELPEPAFPGRDDVRGFTWLLRKP
jgi:hypothetical protein